MRRLGSLGCAVTLCVLASCGGDDVTELVVVVDSNLDVPTDIDTIRVQVSGAATMTATGELTGPRGQPLPRTVGVVHAGGALGPVTIVAQGLSRGSPVVERRVVTSFRSGKTLMLRIYLSASCAHVDCAGNQTCIDGACGSPDVPAASLPEWSGNVGRVDGGTSTCVPVTERCNGVDDDCDGAIDNGFDFETDPINCGGCGAVCNRPNAAVACMAGDCVIAGCDPGFDDCNGNAADGCEQMLDTAEHCGACGMTCTFPNAVAACVGGACALSSCEPGFDDCDMDTATGCEQMLDTVDDCGACGTMCVFANAAARCNAGMCEIEACDAGYDDCNMDPTDGCETALSTLTDCGSCGTACSVANATATCATGMCRVEMCDAGFGDCNTNPADGCERPLATLTDCGMCGRSCNLPSATESCATGTCEITACDAGRGDCNTMPADGCEVDLTRTDMHCGMCGNACPPGDRCRFSTCI